MRRALRHFIRLSVLRRLTAGVLWAVLGATLVAEPLLADVCDGDAPRSARLAVVPHADGNTASVAILSQPQGERALAIVASADDAERTPSAPSGRAPHVVHVCHCVHSHGGTLGRASALRAPTWGRARAHDRRADRVPPGPTLDPALRPPAPRLAA